MLLALYTSISAAVLSVLPQQPRQSPDLHLRTLTFKFVIFSDLHFGEDEDSFGPAQDDDSTQLMDWILELESPHFAVLNGDLITGENTFQHNATKYVDRIVEPLVRRDIPWASTYGNHDTSFNLGREGILAAEKQYDLSLTQQGPIDATDGVTNYHLPIYPDPYWYTDGKPVGLLHFFDSRGSVHLGTKDEVPDFVTNKTASWFRKSSAEARKLYGNIPSLAFVHIPMRAFLDLQNDSAANVAGPHYPGMNHDIPVAEQGQGSESEPFMQALLDTPNLHSIYSGHDHGDSWCGRWPNSTITGETASRPFLCFGKHSGFGGYGRWNRGARIVQLHLDFYHPGEIFVETWVRMQDGSVVTKVNLNDTYGEDVYPTEDGGWHTLHQDNKNRALVRLIGHDDNSRNASSSSKNGHRPGK